jgi:hypothetical protein
MMDSINNNRCDDSQDAAFGGRGYGQTIWPSEPTQAGFAMLKRH